MDHMTPLFKERISALVDGDLQGDACAQTLSALLADAEAVRTWHAYQVVGDVLRSPELAPTRSDQAFWEKLERRLEQEPMRPCSSVVVAAPVAEPAMVAVANEPVFRWKLLAGTSCAVLMAVVGSSVWNPVSPRRVGEIATVQPAASAVVVATETSAGSMLRDSHLDELMAAHRQLGGHSALQVPAGFLRNATYEGGGR
jgi:sigma-E factor negative regulatory protein RseA